MASDPDPAGLGPDAVLRHPVRHPVAHLDVIHAPTGDLAEVTFECAEVASLCPVTGQPDLSTVTVLYRPDGDRIVESKSLKLYLWGFRDRGVFCESMAQEIAARFWEDAAPAAVEVRVRQSVRGGIVTTAVARRDRG